MEEVLISEIGEEYEYDWDDDGETMTLSDGRQLIINPGDIQTTIYWSPTTTLEIRNVGENSFFDLIVRNTMTNEEIRARWEE